MPTPRMTEGIFPRRGRLRYTPEEFWLKSIPTDSGCWEWQGKRNRYGYGVINFQRRRWLAHRLAWVLKGRVIPDGFFVLHHCDNPACVNPCHLYTGTQSNNMDDLKRRERSGLRKLSDKQVLEIRKQNGTRSHRSLAEEYGVSSDLIWKIQTRRQRA